MTVNAVNQSVTATTTATTTATSNTNINKINVSNSLNNDETSILNCKKSESSDFSDNNTSAPSTLVKSASFIYINDLILNTNNLTNTIKSENDYYPNMSNKDENKICLIDEKNDSKSKNYFNNNNNNNSNGNSRNNQNLTINKVGSYVELRLKRISVSKCFLNDHDGDNNNHNVNTNVSTCTNNNNINNNKSPSRFPFYRRRTSITAAATTTATAVAAPVGTSSYSSISRSRSRSSSSCSSLSSSSFSSLFAGDSFRKIKSSKKIKLSVNNNNSNVINNDQTLSTTTTTTTKLVNNNNITNKKLNKKNKKKTQRVHSSNINASSANRSKTKLNCKTTKHNKFSKLNDDYISKSVVTSSISNFSLANSLNASKKLKCLLAGDAKVGKSAMMFLFLKRIFETEYKPTIVDDYEVKVALNGETYTLSLFDTAGQEDWETLRVMAYPDTDIILLCFSVVRPDSMENIKTKWMPELNKYLPDALIVLVGTQVDLRDNNVSPNGENGRARYVTTREGEELKQRINAYKYIECSALTQLNIKEVFDSCIEAYVKSNPPVQPSCFETLFRRFARTIRRRFNLRLHSSNSSSSSSNNKKSTKLNKFSNKESRKYLHEK